MIADPITAALIIGLVVTIAWRVVNAMYDQL